MLFEGLQLPLTTPFYPDGRLNLPKLEHNVARYSKTPAAGLVALSEWGEPTMLSDDETRQTLRCVADAATVEKVLIAGVSRDSLVGTLDLSESAAQFGYDAVLVKPPTLFRADNSGDREKELLAYFLAVADRSALPVVLNGAFSRSDGSLLATVVIELARHPRILGYVDGAGGRERLETLKAGTAEVKHEMTVTATFAAVTARMQAQSGDAAGGLVSADVLTGGSATGVIARPKTAVRTRTKVVGFQMLSAATVGMLDALQVGAVGVMPGFAACAPQACYEVFAAWKDGDESLALEKQARLHHVAEKVEEELGVAGIKFGCDLNGYFGGRPRLPQLPLSGEERAEMESLMQGLRN
jgi:dihydrodipicolinate synthase/N-acetylneuraminate lyase